MTELANVIKTLVSYSRYLISWLLPLQLLLLPIPATLCLPSKERNKITPSRFCCVHTKMMNKLEPPGTKWNHLHWDGTSKKLTQKARNFLGANCACNTIVQHNMKLAILSKIAPFDVFADGLN